MAEPILTRRAAGDEAVWPEPTFTDLAVSRERAEAAEALARRAERSHLLTARSDEALEFGSVLLGFRHEVVAQQTRVRVLTVDELADAVGFTRKKTYRWLAAGRFPGVTQPGGPGTEYVISSNTPARFFGQTTDQREA